MTIVGAVLAGGRSARMGRDKAGITIDDEHRTLGERAVSTLRAVCDDVVVLGHGRSMPNDVARIVDALDDAGPAGGLLALLRCERAHTHTHTHRYVVVAVDMPNVRPEHLRALLDRGSIACFTCEGALQPLPLVIDAGARDRVEELVANGERRLTEIVAALAPKTVAVDRDVVRNVNRPDD